MRISWQHIREKTPLKKTPKKKRGGKKPRQEKKTSKRSQEREMHAIPPNCGVPLRRSQRSLQVRVKSCCEQKNIRRSCSARHRRREDEEDEGELREAHVATTVRWHIWRPESCQNNSPSIRIQRSVMVTGVAGVWPSDESGAQQRNGDWPPVQHHPDRWNYFYLRKKENRRFLSFTLATSPATAGRQVTRNRWPAAQIPLNQLLYSRGGRQATGLPA